MATTSQIVGGVILSAFLGLATGIALTPGPADAGYGVSAKPAVISNHVAKADKLLVKTTAQPKAVEVANIRNVGPDFVLTDARGNVVYRSNRAAQTTTIAKNTEGPLITGYGVAHGPSRVEQAFQQTGY
jgi:hypothetical protein